MVANQSQYPCRREVPLEITLFTFLENQKKANGARVCVLQPSQ